ncbi:MAG: DUF1963 domain-containing protein [Arcicella sp.]|nr:DUF1963 domain-containing protein [Arcicella sp.]
MENQDTFQIGKHTFTITESNFSIAKMTHEFYFEVKAKIENPQQAIKQELLNDYEEGEISWYFSCLGIHKNGIPTGEFTLEEDKTTDPYFYLRRTGFHYNLDFYGKIIFKDGWMICEGDLKNNYYGKPIFPVKIHQKFDFQNLDWKEYHFSSIHETEGVADKLVQYLNLKKDESSELPSKVFQFKNLKNINIGSYQDYYSQTHGPINKISDRIGELSKLEGLSIINSAITELPESIGKLKNLQTLNVMNCQLKSLPESLFSLPKLMYIFADDNQISSVPENINLPNLFSFSFDNNQLKTLPESVALLPKLNSLKIDRNPLESLPTAFNQVKGLEMNIKDKRRLLDFEYCGADGKGILQWDDSQFFADPNSPILQPVREIIKKNKLTKYQSDLLAMSKKSVCFMQKEADNYEKIGNTRFGGMPDLPKSIKYPKFKNDYDKTTYKYEFITQINCAEIANFQEYMPRKGMLYFFLSSLHFFGSEDKFKLAQVLYYDGEEELISGKKLKFNNEDYYEMMGEGCYQGFQVAVNESVSIPNFYSYQTNTHIFKNRAENLLNTFETDEKFERGFYNIFDEPVSELYKSDFEMNGYIFTQHESPELQAALSKKGEPQDWINLLKVSSMGDFQWGDAGDLAFVIHKSDLLKKDFSNVFCTMESS